MNTLTKEQYDNLDVVTLFSEKYSRSYGSITIDSKTYKFSWQSTLIEPQIEFFKPNIVGIGIDQRFCLLDSFDGRYLSLPLISNFFFMKAVDQWIFVVCEIEIKIINMNSFKKEKSFLFDEIIKDVSLTRHIMKISFLNEEDVEIDLNAKTIYDC